MYGKQIFIGIPGDNSDIKNKEIELRKTTEKLQLLHEQVAVDMDMGSHVMDKLIFKASLDADPQILYHLKPSVQFSGDLISAFRAPSGQLYVMLADGTGHGLAAAVSVLPAFWVFSGMVLKGFSVSDIAAEINTRLKKTIPLGRFVPAHIGSISNPTKTVHLWSGGMPSAWLIDDQDGRVQEFPSDHLALGILNNDEFDAECKQFEWNNQSQLLMFSDGLCEANNTDGEMLGEEKIKTIITSKPGKTLLNQVLESLNNHLQDKPANDDISIVNILLPR